MTLFTWQNAFKIHPFYTMCQYVFPFNGRIIFHGMNKPHFIYPCIQFSSVQSLSRVWLFATPWIAARHAPLSFTISWSLLKFISIELVRPSNHLILCHLLLSLPSIFPRMRVFSNELTPHIRWPEYWSFSFSISPSNEYSGQIFFRIVMYNT